MKIEAIQTYILRSPLDKPFYSSQARFTDRNSLLVRICTDDGIVGWGEGGQYGPPEPVACCINDVLAPRLINTPADTPNRTFEELYAFSRDFGQKGTYIEALSAIDIALWDIMGKSLGRPVHALLGGAFRNQVKAYGTGCYYPDFFADTPKMLAALESEAQQLKESGLRAVKIKIGLLPIEIDGQRVDLVRQIFGPGFPLMIDANHAYNATSATRMGRRVQSNEILWFEEPVTPEDHAGYQQVRSALNIPIAGGECEFTRYGFRDLIEDCVDIVQLDLCCAGGFTEWQKISALASIFSKPILPHVWGSGIAVAAALQALATAPPCPHTAHPVALQNEPMIEFDRTPNPIRDDLLQQPFRLENGYLAVPTGPGLGVDIDEAVLQRLTVSH
ncbi:MAG: mandelate racemase/muconate lactonizing enzyme family protein [Acidiferrobacteraceae bacterium]|nr:mandelate racemase/muconate lactonizing enzyme family protein [Acidiferrobacteraceae bacterium]MBT3973557.1 mandelate racemase/muconate lactonizing enzyme family protein [Acidiferrobacteraceae bacterium]MBT5886836.1 mandelate racemase/muconate lactonizing enzyme family protein [Acidiferrobacteraceae bacterium]MBT6732898.1 mandelate racemase/muconate lactonizing enzyme family protein [Acidiferrobacteraceae bacterium]MBT6787916.1 mandelate racemase/muconate lactonizing enzyme family protein [A